MKIYVDSNGNIFVNLKQPLYFKVSTSPDTNSKKYLLTSTITPDIVNPVYLKKEGKNIVYTPWAIDPKTHRDLFPLRNVNFIIYADGTPPTTVIKFNKKRFIYNNHLIFSPKLQISLHAHDNLSGLQTTLISINNNPFKPYTNNITLSKQGKYTIKFFSADNVGNTEKIKSISFFIDATPPKANIIVNGLHIRNILSPNCNIIISANDQISGLKKVLYNLDVKNTFSTYKHPLQVKSLLDGWHTLYYQLSDNVGNSSKLDSFNFYLDKTPPIILQNIIGITYFVGNKQFLSVNSKLKLSAIDNFSGVKAIYYSFDGKNWQKYSKPIPLPKTGKTFTIQYYAVDSVGNKSQIQQNASSGSGMLTAQIDLMPPKISYSFSNSYKFYDTIYLSKNSRIYLFAKDLESGVKYIEYQIDKDTILKYSKPFNITSPGTHTVAVTASDNVNNIGFKTFSVKVDTTAPKIFLKPSLHPIATNNNLPVFCNTTKFFVYAVDNKVGLKQLLISINNQPPKPFKTAITDLKPGLNTITVTAFDYLNNKNKKTFKFYIQPKL